MTQFGGFIMARKNDTPQKAAMRELMSGYLKQNNVKIKDGTDVNAIMRYMMSVILEGALDEEMNEELGYSRYDYRNKETDNSRNGHSQKTMHTSYGDMEIDIPRDRKRGIRTSGGQKISEYRHPGHGRKNPLHVCQGHDHQ